MKDKWISVNDRLPSHHTKYAGPYGVDVMVFDEIEHGQAGCVPSTALFMFEEGMFKIHASGPSGHEWLEAFWVSHWREKPDIPEEFK